MAILFIKVVALTFLTGNNLLDTNYAGENAI